MIFRIKIIVASVNPIWTLKEKNKNFYEGSKDSITEIRSISGQTIGYRRTIRHGKFIREWESNV